MTFVRIVGELGQLSTAERTLLLDRAASSDDGVRDRVAWIIARVRQKGLDGRDAELFALARELDGVELDALEVPLERCRRALEVIPQDMVRVMERARNNIEHAHRAFIPCAVEVETEPGILVGRRPDPLARVGIYAPGGRAAYPSSVLMGAVPARVAGVREVVLCSPPGADGEPSLVVLAAAALAGVDRVFSLGGAGAIAAMAYGTAIVPRVDRIIGPGNAYVAEAKLQVANVVAIDSPAGPSELLIIDDGSTDPSVIARELLAQAEHDPLACVVCVTVGNGAGPRERILAALATHVATQTRRDIIEQSLASRGAVLSAGSIDEAVHFASEYAPEHLLLAITDPAPQAVLATIRNAGAVFLGASSSVSFGDYMTGANHVLPTGALARAYSGLSTLDFVRWTSYQNVDPAAARRLARDVAIFAEAEMLPAHAAAALAWETST